MQRFFLLLAMLALYSATATPVSAESFVIEHPAPKGVVGNDGIKCIGEASHNGNSYRYVAWVGADADEMASDHPDTERTWQMNDCKRSLYDPNVFGSMAMWIRHGYDGSLCLRTHPGARILGVGESEDDYCYVMPPAPDFDPSTIKMTIERV